MPVARLIGFETRVVSKGIAAVTLNAGAQHANPMGTLHGEFFATLPMRRWVLRLRARWRRTKVLLLLS